MNLYNGWENFKVPFMPDGESGDWKIETFKVSEEDAKWSDLRCTINPHHSRGREVPSGTYKRLTNNGSVVMSDTRAEIFDHEELIRNRKGNVLIHGLGLGMAVNACLMSEDLGTLTVVELSEDVIKLVAPALRRQHYKAYKAGRFRVIQGDAFTWDLPRGFKWDFIWHDIWDDLCFDNWDGMKSLHRRFARRHVNGQDSWGRDWVKDQLSQRRGF